MNHNDAQLELECILNEQKTVSIPKLKRLLEAIFASNQAPEILKSKNGVPTKISFNGHEYALVHPNYINGHKSKVKRKA